MKYKNLGIPAIWSPDSHERVARQALDTAQADPTAAIRMAAAVLEAEPSASLEAQSVALRALDLAGMPADPADRLIVATALEHHASLVTADEKLLAWRHGLERHDARD